MLCQNCLKDLEAAFVLRSSIIHQENSYFQLRRDEIEDMHFSESGGDEPMCEPIPMMPAVALKLEAVEESFAVQITNIDPLFEGDDNDYEDRSEADDVKDEDYEIKERKVVECPECHKFLSSPQALAKHIRCIHEGKKNFSCEICNTKFATKYNLEQHLIRHIKNPESKVTQVIKDTSNQNRPFKCELCNSYFKTIASMRQHKAIHTDIRPFKCQVCGKAFRRNDHLKGHKDTHVKKKN